MKHCVKLHASFDEIAALDWDRCLPAQAENWTYYRACEACEATGPHPRAVSFSLDGKIVAVGPLFTLHYRLDSPLDGCLRKLTDAIERVSGGMLTLRLLGIGSPYAERCHLGFDADLGEESRSAALAAMLSAIQVYARDAGISLVILKDLDEMQAGSLRPQLTAMGFARMSSLPLAVLELPSSEVDYLASLGKSRRREIRRKLKKCSAITMETVSDVSAIAGDISRLYESTHEHSQSDYGDFEVLPDGFFREISRLGPGQIMFKLYRSSGSLIAFNLLFLQPDRVIDKFIGIDYATPRDCDLYLLSWMENVRQALQLGIRRLQSGQTAYRRKLELGSRLLPCAVYFRHRSALLHLVLSMLSRWLAPDRRDPDLKAAAR